MYLKILFFCSQKFFLILKQIKKLKTFKIFEQTIAEYIPLQFTLNFLHIANRRMNKIAFFRFLQ